MNCSLLIKCFVYDYVECAMYDSFSPNSLQRQFHHLHDALCFPMYLPTSNELFQIDPYLFSVTDVNIRLRGLLFNALFALSASLERNERCLYMQ